MEKTMCASYELLTNWEPSNRGYTAKATRGGKTFFLKKYNNYIMPNEAKKTTRPEFYEKKKLAFDSFKDYRVSINKELAKIAGPGGNIIYPTDSFVWDNCFVEATEFIPDLIEEDAILALPASAIDGLMQTAAAALNGVHNRKIVHSDLKRGNIVAAKNPSGSSKIPVLAKILDFDMSYFDGNIHSSNDLGGTQQYMSPEFTNSMIHDYEESTLTALSTKSDIFSLGIIFYNYLANGEYPPITDLPDYLKDKEVVYSGEAICNGAKLHLKKSKIKDKYMRCLLANMLHPDPTMRPSANEVMITLKTKEVMPIKPADQIVVEDAADAVTPPPAPVDPDNYMPWPEHGVVFDMDALNADSWLKVERCDRGKTYTLTRSDGAIRNYSIGNMKALGYAKKSDGSTPATGTSPSPAPTPAPTPSEIQSGLWEEHAAYEVSEKGLNEMRCTFAGHKLVGGKHMYVLLTFDGKEKVMNFQNLVLLDVLKKK